MEMTETRWSYVCSECRRVIEVGEHCTDVWTQKGKSFEHTWRHEECSAT